MGNDEGASGSDDAAAHDDTLASDGDQERARSNNPARAQSSATDDTVAAADAMSTDETLPVPPATADGRPPIGDSADDLTELPIKDPSRYVRGRQIARGGMGRIVSVRDRELKRNIAIKELLARNPAMERRFEREVLISARLQHPSIIAVLEAGRWPGGEPFYTMKHVEGRPLDKVIAEKKMLRERLSLLPNVIAVADALAYAHARGVIHRDLKPSNVLVGDYGETVVIDWGLAKDLRTSAADDPEVSAAEKDRDDGATILGHALGTPAYMPPEQARGEPVDERADVYSLGAMLHHLLAGQMPYADEKPTDASWLLDRVKTAPPTAVGQLEPDTPADLLAIVDKAMSRDPRDRYSNARRLADDLKRFETGQLVGAHEYSTWQLVTRWGRRHRAAVSVAAVMALVLAAGGAFSFWRISRERDRAEEQKAVAEEKRGEVEELLDFMLVELQQKLKPVGKLDLLETVSDRASAYFASRVVDWSRPNEARKRALAHSSLGDVRKEQGDLSGALREYQASRMICARLVEQDPSYLDGHGCLAESHERIGDVLTAEGDFAGAITEHRAALRIRESAVGEEPRELVWKRSIGVSHEKIGRVLEAQGDFDGALAQYLSATATREHLVEGAPNNQKWQRELSIAYLDGARMRIRRGELGEARAALGNAKEISERLVACDPSNTIWQHDLAVSHDHIGRVLALQRDVPGALEAYREARQIHESLVGLDPHNSRWRLGHLDNYNATADLLRKTGDVAGAVADYQTGKRIAEQLVALDPRNSAWLARLASVRAGLGNAQRQQGDLPGALIEIRAAQGAHKRLLDIDRDNTTWQNALASDHRAIGIILEHQGDLDGASSELRAAIAIRQGLLKAPRGASEYERYLAADHAILGSILKRLNDHEGARRHLVLSAEGFSRAALIAPDFYNAACANALAGKPGEAFAMLEKALEKGYRNAAHAESDPDLATLRTDPRWKPLIERMAAKNPKNPK